MPAPARQGSSRQFQNLFFSSCIKHLRQRILDRGKGDGAVLRLVATSWLMFVTLMGPNLCCCATIFRVSSLIDPVEPATPMKSTPCCCCRDDSPEITKQSTEKEPLRPSDNRDCACKKHSSHVTTLPSDPLGGDYGSSRLEWLSPSTINIVTLDYCPTPRQWNWLQRGKQHSHDRAARALCPLLRC